MGLDDIAVFMGAFFSKLSSSECLVFTGALISIIGAAVAAYGGYKASREQTEQGEKVQVSMQLAAELDSPIRTFFVRFTFDRPYSGLQLRDFAAQLYIPKWQWYYDLSCLVPVNAEKLPRYDITIYTAGGTQQSFGDSKYIKTSPTPLKELGAITYEIYESFRVRAVNHLRDIDHDKIYIRYSEKFVGRITRIEFIANHWLVAEADPTRVYGDNTARHWVFLSRRTSRPDMLTCMNLDTNRLAATDVSINLFDGERTREEATVTGVDSPVED